MRGTIEIGLYEAPQPICVLGVEGDPLGSEGPKRQVMRASFCGAVAVALHCALVIFLFSPTLIASRKLEVRSSGAPEEATISAFILEPPPSVPQPTNLVSSIPTDHVAPLETERLEGIYRRQIEARINRALESSQLKGIAACRYNIRQASDGTILNVRVGHCRAGEDSQRKLVTALLQGSPLPAPPEASVFKAMLLVDIGKDIRVRFQ
jgi:hypothetical protein